MWGGGVGCRCVGCRCVGWGCRVQVCGGVGVDLGGWGCALQTVNCMESGKRVVSSVALSRLLATAWSVGGTLLRWQTLVWLVVWLMTSIRLQRGPNSPSSGQLQRSSRMLGSAASQTCGRTVRVSCLDG